MDDKQIKYKARLVVLGNLQKKKIKDLFAPTANDKSVRLLMTLATAKGLLVKSIDVFGAFLYPTQKEEIYIVLPSGVTGDTPVYWKLNKTMYGLASSPAAFYEHVSTHLLENGYTRCKSDPCFFYLRPVDSNDYILIVIHVDDFVVAKTNQDMINDLITNLEKTYVVSTTESVNHFLGINIQERTDGSRFLSQPGLLKKLFEKHHEVSNLTTYPSVPMASTFCEEEQSESPKCNPTKFMQLLGSLLFLNKTRPDIAYAVNRMAMRASTATHKDMKDLLRIVAYLYDTSELGITLTPTTNDFKLIAWCDASYATHPDGRSHSAYGFTSDDPNCAMFFLRSTKQTNVTLSSTEAEITAAVEATKDIIWLRTLLEEIGFPQAEPTPIHVDNASMIVLGSNYSGNHKKVKHYMIRLNFLMEQVKMGNVVLVKVHTDDNISDIGTKPMGPTQFIKLRNILMGTMQGN